MKEKTLTIIIIAGLALSIFASSCSAQRPIVGNSVEGINQRQLQIKTISGIPIKLTTPLNEITQKLGSPTSNTIYEYEIQEKTGSLLKYGASEIYVMDNNLYSFIITTANILVGVNGKYIKIGDDISKIEEMYSNASNFKKNDYYEIQLTLGDRVNEGTFLVVEFNQMNKITKIGKYEN